MTGPPRRRERTTDAQRQLAAQWLTRTGREVSPATVEELARHVRVTGKPELPEIQAFARLVRLGQVPTPGAVRGEMASLAASEARRRALKQAKAAVLDTSRAPAGRPRPTWRHTGSAPGPDRAGQSCAATPAGRGRSPMARRPDRLPPTD